MPDPGPKKITEAHLDRISLVFHAGMHQGRDIARLFVKQKVGNMFRIIGIVTTLAISFASSSKNAATLGRHTRAIGTLDCKLLATANKLELALDVEREANIAKEMPKCMLFLLQLLDSPALSTSFWLLRSVMSHLQALLTIHGLQVIAPVFIIIIFSFAVAHTY